MRWNVLMFPAGPSSSYLLPLKQREPPISSAPVYITRSRSFFRQTFYLLFLLSLYSFSSAILPSRFERSSNRAEDYRGSGKILRTCADIPDKGQRPYRTVDLAALVSRCASFFLFFPPLNSTNCTNLLTFQRFQRVGPSR